MPAGFNYFNHLASRQMNQYSVPQNLIQMPRLNQVKQIPIPIKVKIPIPIRIPVPLNIKYLNPNKTIVIFFFLLLR